MRIAVDYDRCEGNARCMRLCPEVFEVGEDDKVRVLVDNAPEGLRAKIDAAVRSCPRLALAIVEE